MGDSHGAHLGELRHRRFRMAWKAYGSKTPACASTTQSTRRLVIEA